MYIVSLKVTLTEWILPKTSDFLQASGYSSIVEALCLMVWAFSNACRACHAWSSDYGCADNKEEFRWLIKWALPLFCNISLLPSSTVVISIIMSLILTTNLCSSFLHCFNKTSLHTFGFTSCAWQLPEFKTVSLFIQLLNALCRYSPLHNVRQPWEQMPGEQYGPTMLLTADHDDQVVSS